MSSTGVVLIRGMFFHFIMLCLTDITTTIHSRFFPSFYVMFDFYITTTIHSRFFSDVVCCHAQLRHCSEHGQCVDEGTACRCDEGYAGEFVVFCWPLLLLWGTSRLIFFFFFAFLFFSFYFGTFFSSIQPWLQATIARRRRWSTLWTNSKDCWVIWTTTVGCKRRWKGEEKTLARARRERERVKWKWVGDLKVEQTDWPLFGLADDEGKQNI